MDTWLKPLTPAWVVVIALLCLLIALPSCSSGGGCDLTDGNFNFGSLHPSQAAEVIAEHQGHQDFSILDVRTPAEFATGHLSGARNLDFRGDFAAGLASYDPDDVYLVYCKGGGRTAQAVEVMEGLGYSHLFQLWGGIDNWANQGFPVE